MVYTIVSLQQDEFRTNCFYFIPSVSAFCRYAQNVARLSSCRDQALTHRQSDRHTDTQTYYKTTIILCLHAQVKIHWEYAYRQYNS